VGAGKNKDFRIYRLPCGHEQEIQPGNFRKGSFRCQTCLDEKLKAEAEAQDCKLLGPGRNRGHRTYRLPCGHERDIATGNMRIGYVHCQICFNHRLNEEAKAQGCELLGEGRSAVSRTYLLPCGHEQDIGTGSMRSGGFRCQTCLKNKLVEEAESRGCVLLGPGKDRNYRTYRLTCGHEQEIAASSIRTGEFRCQTCLVNGLREEAEAQGCKLLGPGRDKNYCTYLLPCGHQHEVVISHMRKGNYRCQICIDEKLKAEADAQGCEILGAGKKVRYQIYRLPCGHKQEIANAAMRGGRWRCQICLDDRLKAEAEDQGCELLGPGKDNQFRTYRLPCGHEQEISPGNLRRGGFHCQICFEAKMPEEAEARGCLLLGPGRNATYRTYQLPCGHEQDIKTDHMRTGNFRCQTCEEYAFTRPSDVYLLHIKVGSDEWLKLGYTNNLEYRVSRYALPLNAEWSALAILPFDTGLEAMRFEKALHTKYRRKRLRAKDMLSFHMGSGSTECYPLTMVEKLMLEMKADS